MRQQHRLKNTKETMPVVEVNFSCGVGRIRLFCVFSGFQDFRISGFSFLLPINKSFTRDFLQETVGNCCSQHSTHGNVGAMQLRKQVLTCSSRQKKVFCSTPLLSVFTKKKGLNKKHSQWIWPEEVSQTQPFPKTLPPPSTGCSNARAPPAAPLVERRSWR